MEIEIPNFDLYTTNQKTPVAITPCEGKLGKIYYHLDEVLIIAMSNGKFFAEFAYIVNDVSGEKYIVSPTSNYMEVWVWEEVGDARVLIKRWVGEMTGAVIQLWGYMK